MHDLTATVSHQAPVDRQKSVITSPHTTYFNANELDALRNFAEKMTHARHQHAGKAATWTSPDVPVLASGLKEIRRDSFLGFWLLISAVNLDINVNDLSESSKSLELHSRACRYMSRY